MAIRAAATRATQPFDYVLSPVSPVPTYRAEWETPTNDVQRPLEHISFTMPYNMSEQPAASINCGYTQGGQADRPADRRPPLRRSRRDAAVALVRDGEGTAEDMAGSPEMKPVKQRAARHPDARHALPAHQGRHRQCPVLRLPGDLPAHGRHRPGRRGDDPSRPAARAGRPRGQCPGARRRGRDRPVDELRLPRALSGRSFGPLARAGRDLGAAAHQAACRQATSAC